MAISLRNRLAICLAAAAAIFAVASPAHAWSHQGHILLTRLAVLRIINDPAAPAGLKDFLRANMKYDLEACHRLATQEHVNAEAKDYTVGFDGAATFPDRVIYTQQGKTLLQPYNAPEAKMHFVDMEWVGKYPSYKPDLSNLPKIEDIPTDVKDPRWQQAGFVPFRIEEVYQNFKLALGKDGKPLNSEEALKWGGYLAHYLEDCHQPQHSTIDFKSYSYLDGVAASVHKVTRKASDGTEIFEYRMDDGSLDPHANLERGIFENDEYREAYWTELLARIDAKAKKQSETTQKELAAPFDGFHKALSILSDSYTYLPAVGKATRAGYIVNKPGWDKQDWKAYFTSTDEVHGEKMSTIQLIADRNASAVLEVEKAFRHAWADGHPK